MSECSITVGTDLINLETMMSLGVKRIDTPGVCKKANVECLLEVVKLKS